MLKKNNRSNKYPINRKDFTQKVLPKMYEKVTTDIDRAASMGLDSMVVKLNDKNDPTPGIMTDTATASHLNEHCTLFYESFKKSFGEKGYKVSELDPVFCYWMVLIFFFYINQLLEHHHLK
jgi:hypothetical protein